MMSAYLKQILCIISGPLACFLISQMNAPAGLEQQGMLNLGACVWIMLWWFTEVFPMTVTAILSIPIYAFLGLLAPAKAFSFLGSSSVMLIFGATILVGLLKESNFLLRYAYLVMNSRLVQGSPFRLFLLFSLSTGLLSAIAPNIPLIIIFVYIVVSLARNCEVKPNNKMARGLTVLAGAAPAIGGIGTPLGGVPNLVVIAMIANIVGQEVTFWQWSALGLPTSIISLVILSFIAYFYFRTDEKVSFLDKTILEGKLRELGPLTRYETIAMVTMGIALVLWSFGPNIAEAIGWTAGKKLMNGPFVAVLMGAVTFLIPLRKNEKDGTIVFSMDWKKALSNISWDILVTTLGILAFGDVLLSGGIDKWMASLLQGILGNISGMWVLLICILFSGLGSQIVSNLALISLVVPMTASLAAIYDFNVLAACVSVGMASNVAVMFPFSSVGAATAISGGGEYAFIKDFAGYGFFASLSISIIIFCCTVLYGDMLFPL